MLEFAVQQLSACSWFKGMPGEEPGPRYLFERTTHDTASAAAVLASAARVWAPYDQETASAWLAIAEKAWDFLMKHPEAPVGGFKNPLYPSDCPGDTGEASDEYDSDNRLHAAAELYRTTGREVYHNYVRAWFADPVFTSGNSGAGAGKYPQVYWAYLMTAGRNDSDAAIRAKCAKYFLDAGQGLLTAHLGNPYLNAARLDVAAWIGWGTFTYGTREGLQLLMAWVASGRRDNRYREAAAVNIDSQFGSNPQSASFVTGKNP
jgi:endoglucanase